MILGILCVSLLLLLKYDAWRGRKQKKTSITTEYEKPTKENRMSLGVGRRTDTFWPGDKLTYAQ